MSSQRRRRPGRSRVPEWTPDHHWPEDEGWPDQRGWPREEDGNGGRRGSRAQTLAVMLGAGLFVAGLGVYGVARQHAAVASLQDSAATPCAAPAGTAAARCRSSAPGGATDGSGRPAPGASGTAAGTGTPTPRASASSKPGPTPGMTTPTSATPAATPTAPAAAGATSSPPAAASGSAASQVLALINQARVQAGLPALAISSGLDTSALGHTMVMAAGCGLQHQCPGEPALGTRLTTAGVHWTSAGENIGEGGPEPASSTDIAALAVSLTQAMLNEQPPNDGHRLNILGSSFRHIGIYVFRDASGKVWMTQDFSN